jgi:hypothetical protein
MVNHNHYTYRVTWSQEDQEFVGLCAEFPSLSYLHEDNFTALKAGGFHFLNSSRRKSETFTIIRSFFR